MSLPLSVTDDDGTRPANAWCMGEIGAALCIRGSWLLICALDGLSDR